MKIYDYNGKKNICGYKIAILRASRKMSQSDLAAQLQTNGITLERDSISRIENGTRFVTDYEVKVLAKLFNVTTEWLLDESMDFLTTPSNK